MAANEARDARAQEGEVFTPVIKLLGGKRVFKRAIRSRLDVHEALAAGLPRMALVRVAQDATGLRQEDVANALGISVRTLQRIAESPEDRLTKEQSGRAWKFAEILARAAEAMGGREPAVAWLKTESLALGGRRPIELLSTTAGTELVEQLLGRLEHGVYT